MTDGLKEDVENKEELRDPPEVFDLLSQTFVSRGAKNDTPQYDEELQAEDATSAEDKIEDLEDEAEGTVLEPPSLDHLQPAVQHNNLQPIVDGKLNGVVQAHDQDGNLLSHHYYEDGVLQGESRKYDEDQRLRDRVTYKDGVPHGPAEFYRNGKALMSTHYQNGELHGETTYYNPNSGMVTARVGYDSGKKNGTSITYDALGKPQRIIHYVDGELEGPAFSYHPDGGVMQEGYYLNGRKHGQFTSYYRNGETRAIEFYENGRLTRKPVLFTPAGEEYEPEY